MLGAVAALGLSARAAPSDPGCLVCHPSEARSIRESPHGPGVVPGGSEGCLSCHEALSGHTQAAFERPEGARWTASLRVEACAPCHGTLREGHPAGDRRAGACGVCHRAHPAAAPPPRARDRPGIPVGEWRLRGHVEAGLRAVSVDGSRTRFRQDSDIDSGPRLRELALEATRGEGEAPSLRLLLRDVGDPFPSGAVDLALAGGVSISAYGRRDSLVAVASDDVHGFDVDREESGARVRIEADPEAGPVLDVGASRLVEEGDYLATSNFNVAEPFPPTPGRVTQTQDSLDAGGRFELSGFEIAVRQRAAARRGEEDLSFSEPNEFIPGVENRLERDLEDETLTLETLVSCRRRLSDDADFTLRARYLDADGEGDLRSRASGAFAGTDFARVESGSMDVGARDWEIAGALSFLLAATLRASLFARFESEDRDGASDLRQVLASPPGTPSVTLDFANETSERSTVDAAGIDLDTDLGETWSLRGGGEFGRERLRIEVRAFNTTIVDRTERLPRALLYGGATWRPRPALALDVDLRGRRYGALDEFYRETTARGWEASARARWRPAESLAVAIAGRYERSTVDVFDSLARIAAVEADATYRPGPSLAATLLVSRRDEDLAAVPTVSTLGGPTERTFDFDAVTDLLGARLLASLDARTRSETGLSLGRTRGDADVTVWSLAERIEHDPCPGWTVGLEALARRYDPDSPTLEPGYDALVATLFARWTF